MKKNIYIFSNGQLKRKQNTLFFENSDGQKKFIPVEDTSEILLFGEVDINKKLLDFLSQKQIILHFFNYYQYYIGSFYPREHYNSGYMIIKQVEIYNNTADRLFLAKRFVKGAIHNILKVLKYYHDRGVDLEDRTDKITELWEKAEQSKNIEELMGYEGNTREVYYNSFDRIIKNPDFRFIERTKRPPLNYLNSMISFINTLVYTTVLSMIYQTHLDPRIGFLHTSNSRKFSLNLDIAEVFKPLLVDRLIFSLINKREITGNSFDNKVQGIVFKENAVKKVIERFDERLKTTVMHKELNREVTYKRLILMECYKIEKHLMGEKDYEPFFMWW
jgi:CRISPR-associated protein Cas1